VIGRTQTAIDDLDLLQAQNRPMRREAEDLIRGLIAKPRQGKPLRDEWIGCRGLHFGSDKYRLIWEILPAIDDYEGQQDDKVIPIIILRVGPKIDAQGNTIYESPRPSAL
jgi:hypothetical protein